MMNELFTLILTGGLMITLVVLAVIDTRTFTISNGANAAIALAAPLYWWAAGLDWWPGAAIQIGVAAAVFLALAITFALGMMGGGDVKLAAALALWFAPADTVRFLIVMSLAGGVLTVLVLWANRGRAKAPAESEAEPAKPEVPYGVAIAVGGLWILAQRFLNHFA